MKPYHKILFFLTIALFSITIQNVQACEVNQLSEKEQDQLAQLLRKWEPCPGNVFEFKQELKREGLATRISMVANRGFHNSNLGSFSFFEMVLNSGAKRMDNAGQFFFGHFTQAKENTIVADQVPRKGALMIELIVWDSKKGWYNFYEMIGNGKNGIWFYRGDSKDILKDIEWLHRKHPETKQKSVFGKRLRCSGCHLSGGPIMKELHYPHNDWWLKERPLPLAGNTIGSRLVSQFKSLKSASILAQEVKIGIERLNRSQSFIQLKKSLSLQERLRPLFCPEEINFRSAERPLDTETDLLSIPSSYLLNPRLNNRYFKTSRSQYLDVLKQTKSQFREIKRSDGDHPWLAPVKAFSDTRAIRGLIQQELVDSEFVFDVLAIDMTNPALSSTRCGLLKLVPKYSANWQQEFKKTLQSSPLKSAQNLYLNLSDSERNSQYHLSKSSSFLKKCQHVLKSSGGLLKHYRLLAQRRTEIRVNQLSSNPRGQILEPGFRVIFPTLSPAAQAGKLMLNEECEVRVQEIGDGS